MVNKISRHASKLEDGNCHGTRKQSKKDQECQDTGFRSGSCIIRVNLIEKVRLDQT